MITYFDVCLRRERKRAGRGCGAEDMERLVMGTYFLCYDGHGVGQVAVGSCSS